MRKAKVDLSYQPLPRPTKIKDAIERLGKHPNDELWEALEAAMEEIAIPERPDGSFTVVEYAAHEGISRDAAARRVYKLLRLGKIKKMGKGNNTYYLMVTK